MKIHNVPVALRDGKIVGYGKLVLDYNSEQEPTLKFDCGYAFSVVISNGELRLERNEITEDLIYVFDITAHELFLEALDEEERKPNKYIMEYVTTMVVPACKELVKYFEGESQVHYYIVEMKKTGKDDYKVVCTFGLSGSLKLDIEIRINKQKKDLYTTCNFMLHHEVVPMFCKTLGISS